MRLIFVALLIVSLLITSGCAKEDYIVMGTMGTCLTGLVTAGVLSEIASDRVYKIGYAEGAKCARSDKPAHNFVVMYRAMDKGKYRNGFFWGYLDEMYLMAIRESDDKVNLEKRMDWNRRIK